MFTPGPSRHPHPSADNETIPRAAIITAPLSNLPPLPHRRILATGILIQVLLLNLANLRLPRGGAGGSPEAVLDDRKAAPPSPEEQQERGGERAMALEGWAGVVLWPEQRDDILLVPPPPAMLFREGDARRRDPLAIPFFGAYWLYRKPYRQPPPGSPRVHGTPTTHAFRSADGRPLIMEARQNLGVRIPVACCRSIEVHIANVDRYFGTVELEMVLSDTAEPGRPSWPLGTLSVTSTRPWRPGIRRPFSTEVLGFPVRQTPGARFDELLIRFHLSPIRAAHSARIAIDRFVLVP